MSRRLTGWVCAGLLPLALGLLGVGPAAAQTPPDSTGARAAVGPRRVGAAVQQTMLSNLIVNRVNAWGRNAEWAQGLGFKVWTRNLRLGWEWDEDGFTTNMFGHPLQGAYYFNAGRANGLSYWESAPVTAFGSWTWEYFGESERPSLNDFFVTTFGGIAVGEMTHRVAATIRDEQARGAGRLTREIVALGLDPVGGLNRLIRGEWRRVGPNPPEHDPSAFFYGATVGVRHLSSDAGAGTNGPSVSLDLGYGDPFTRPYRDPFDVFAMHLQVSPGSGGGLNTLQTYGRLYQTELPSWSDQATHLLVVGQQFDYLNNPVYQFGGQSAELGVLSRFTLPRGFRLQTQVSGSALILGGVDAPSIPLAAGGDAKRDYDFGPGLGTGLSATLYHGTTPYLLFYSRAEYLHSVSGTPADHAVVFAGLRGNLPVKGGFGVGFHLSGDSRASGYSDRPDITRHVVETQLFLSWTSNRPATPLETP